MPRDPRASLFDMIQAIETAQRLASGFTESTFVSDEPMRWAVFSQIIILGEAAGRLDRSFQNAHPDVPWTSIIGMRHRLVHGYDVVDWVRVWKTLQDDLPPLLAQLRSILPIEGGEEEK